MTEKAELTQPIKTLGTLIRKSNHVYSGCFPIRSGGLDDLLKREAYKRLHENGIKDPSVIFPCNTYGEKVQNMFSLLRSNSKKEGYEKKPWIIVANNDLPVIEKFLIECIENKEITNLPPNNTIMILEPHPSEFDRRQSSKTTINGIKIVLEIHRETGF